jgi:hypothetical protein
MEKLGTTSIHLICLWDNFQKLPKRRTNSIHVIGTHRTENQLISTNQFHYSHFKQMTRTLNGLNCYFSVISILIVVFLDKKNSLFLLKNNIFKRKKGLKKISNFFLKSLEQLTQL